MRPGVNRNTALDGLRGLAVLLVVIGHVSGTWAPYAANVGVTMFFTLSGYLITGLLLRERSRFGKYRLGPFYMRRLLRLYPALIALLLLGAPLLWLAGDPALPKFPGRALVAGTYLTDFVEASGVDLVYLTHTWSLAVEEQFYLVWPWLLLGLLALAARSSMKSVAPLVLGLTAAALAWRIFGALAFPGDRTYFAIDMNAFALLLGCSVAVVPRHLVARVPRAAAPILLVVLLAVSFGLHVRTDAVRDWVVIGSAAVSTIIVCGLTQGARLLELRPLVWFGGVSYALYLWHDFLLHVQWGGQEAQGPWRIAIALVAVVVAYLSTRFVERPFQRLRTKWERLAVRPADSTRAELRPAAD